MHLEPREETSCGYENKLSPTVDDEIIQLRRELEVAYALLAEKDQRINKLLQDRKSADEDLHNLTEQLFQQAYKLVNDEKRSSAELKMRLHMLETENKSLKMTVRSHKRPLFSQHRLTPTSIMPTPVKLSKSPIRDFLHRYSTLLNDENHDHHQQNTPKAIESPARFTEPDHSGCLEVLDINAFAKILIQDLKPRLAMKLPPCLPAFILFAAFRYLDRAADEALLTNLFNAVYAILEDISTSSTDDFDIQALWLVNLWRLLNLLRQYSGNEADEQWVGKNSEQQNGWRLRHFNAEPIRNHLKLRVEDFYQNFMKNTVEPVLTPKISSGILQHEAAPLNVSSEKKQRGDREPSKNLTTQSLDDIKEFLSFVYTKLQAFGADSIVLEQVFCQITQWICTLAIDQLVLRADLCCFEKAIQIKHNVTEIRNWLNQRKLDACTADNLEPLIQASHLLQSRKSESNLETLCGEMTSRLSPEQIISILRHYTPSAGFEEDTVDPDFIAKLSDRLHQRAVLSDGTTTKQESVVAPPTFLRPFDTQPFVYSSEDLQKLTLPPCLKLDSVARLI